MYKAFDFNIMVWSPGIVLDFEFPYIGIGLGPLVIRFGRLGRADMWLKERL